MSKAVSKKTILVVEDEKAMARALELKFQSAGFEVSVAVDGQAALDRLAKQPVDVVLLDLVLPRIDGFGVLEELKRRGNKIPVIVSSNLSQEEDQKRTRDLGAVDYFVKSNTPISEIVARVGKFLQ